jgi:hypothetical protein
MNRRAVEKFDDADLVKLFAETANTLGETINNWIGSGAKESSELIKIGNVLRSRGETARLLLSSLLDSRNRFIQYYAAIELEGVMPERCRRIIEENAKQRDAIAGDAGMHLYAVDSGIYKPE